VGLIVVAEGALIGLLSWALAALAAWPIGRIVGETLVKAMFRSDVESAFDPAGLLAWLALAVVLGAGASLLPAAHASRRPVREAIGYE
jgi:ABC-type lipoprotein release transport system permease subunit